MLARFVKYDDLIERPRYCGWVFGVFWGGEIGQIVVGEKPLGVLSIYEHAVQEESRRDGVDDQGAWFENCCI